MYKYMPVHKRTDSQGKKFYQWGNHGKRYYYLVNSKKSEEMAKQKAAKQGRAAFAHGYRSKGSRHGGSRRSRRTSRKASRKSRRSRK